MPIVHGEGIKMKEWHTGNRCNSRAEFDASNWIPRFIKEGDKIITNPKWINAVYEEVFWDDEKMRDYLYQTKPLRMKMGVK